MSPTLIGIFGIIGLLLLILAGLHVGLVLMIIGAVGTVLMIGWDGGLNILGSSPFATASAYDLSPVPLFFLMGAFAATGGIGTVAFDAMTKLVGKMRGGLAIASTFGAAFFGLACGSSLAATGIFTKIALPEMLKRGYDRKLSIGCIASAGTFSTMIPPSGLLIVYAIFTEGSIGRLFMAGIIPGIITAIVYTVLIITRVSKNPKLAPKIEENFSFEEKFFAMLRTWPILFLGALVLGGIFAGWFTATEAGGIGAFGSLIYVLLNKTLRFRDIPKTLVDCMHMTGMIFLIVIGAIVFARFLSLTQIPVNLANFLQHGEMAFSPTMILIGALCLYFVLGMFLDAVAILAITMPVIFPLIIHAGYDPVWFGIVIVKVGEIGLVTPPVGMNVYVAYSAAEDQVTLDETFQGIAPFIFCDIFVLLTLILFPQICLFLPNLMF
jgi:tripartite ATP-independent transporter DctM subunit